MHTSGSCGRGGVDAYQRGFARMTAHTVGVLLDAAGVEAGRRWTSGPVPAWWRGPRSRAAPG